MEESRSCKTAGLSHLQGAPHCPAAPRVRSTRWEAQRCRPLGARLLLLAPIGLVQEGFAARVFLPRKTLLLPNQPLVSST